MAIVLLYHLLYAFFLLPTIIYFISIIILFSSHFYSTQQSTSHSFGSLVSVFSSLHFMFHPDFSSRMFWRLSLPGSSVGLRRK
jgi:hypothetical protein